MEQALAKVTCLRTAARSGRTPTARGTDGGPASYIPLWCLGIVRPLTFDSDCNFNDIGVRSFILTGRASFSLDTGFT
jgi:hypothetical protein